MSVLPAESSLAHSFDYKIGKYQLSINYWFLVIFLVIQTSLNELGFWQLSRAQEKQERLTKLASSNDIEINNAIFVDQNAIDNFERLKLTVQLAEFKNILIENKIQNGELGYHVLNIVKDTQSGRYFLANRGWIAGTASRQEIPSTQPPKSEWPLEGRIYPINQQVFSQDAVLESYSRAVRLPVLDAYTLTLIEQKFDLTLEPYSLRLNDKNEDVFDVNWVWVSMAPEKHLGYAFQWFGLSLTFLIASVFASIKRNKDQLEENDREF